LKEGCSINSDIYRGFHREKQQRRVLRIIVCKGTKQMARAIESVLNRYAESK